MGTKKNNYEDDLDWKTIILFMPLQVKLIRLEGLNKRERERERKLIL